MHSGEMKRLIQRLYDDGINRHDAAGAAEIYAADARNHGRTVGRLGMQAVFESLFSTFPDFHYHIDEATAEGDRIVEALGDLLAFGIKAEIRKLLHQAL